jgi:hypothetical protein
MHVGEVVQDRTGGQSGHISDVLETGVGPVHHHCPLGGPKQLLSAPLPSVRHGVPNGFDSITSETTTKVSAASEHTVAEPSDNLKSKSRKVRIVYWPLKKILAIS